MVKVLLNHMGIGDAIMLNGMVRHFAETEKSCCGRQDMSRDFDAFHVS